MSTQPNPTPSQQPCTYKISVRRLLSSLRSTCQNSVQQISGFYHRHAPEPINLFTGMLVAIGAIHGWAFIHSERASVVPTDVHLAKEVPEYLKYLEVYFELGNGGKVTATIEHFMVAISHEPLPAEPEYYTAKPFVMEPILPSRNRNTTLHFLAEWAKDYTDAFKDGTKPLFLFGKVQYRDQFSDMWILGEIRETGFCYYWRPKGGVREPMFDVCQNPAYTYTR